MSSFRSGELQVGSAGCHGLATAGQCASAVKPMLHGGSAVLDLDPTVDFHPMGSTKAPLSVLYVPVLSHNNQVVGVLQAINKAEGEIEFNPSDVEVSRAGDGGSGSFPDAQHGGH